MERGGSGGRHHERQGSEGYVAVGGDAEDANMKDKLLKVLLF